MVTVHALYHWSISQLYSCSPTAHLDCEVLLASALKKNREFLFSHPDFPCTRFQELHFKKMLSRRLKGMPVAYITGWKEFFGLQFIVTPDVLIPRPDTEILVETVLDAVESWNIKNPEILELGTGSGCVAISLKKSYPQARITATDISKPALIIAKKNAHLHRVDIQFFRSDLFSHKQLQKKYHCVIFNPPYLTKNESKKKNLRYEPKIALQPITAPKIFFQKIIIESVSHLHANGALFLEIGNQQALMIQNIIRKKIPNFIVRFFNDLGGTKRVAMISKKTL